MLQMLTDPEVAERRALKNKLKNKNEKGKTLNSQDARRLEELKAKNKALKRGGHFAEDKPIVRDTNTASRLAAERGEALSGVASKSEKMESSAREFGRMCKELNEKRG